MNRILFVDDMARPGAINMALDDIMGRYECLREFDCILRTYHWRKPTLSCGFHQKADRRLNWQACNRYGVDLVMRPTGGRELLHDGDMSFCLAKKRRDVNGNAYSEAKEFFFQAGRIIASGLKALGIKAEAQTGNLKIKGLSAAPCLAAVSQYEVVADGKKIVPMAQRIYPEAIILHGSLPLRDSAISTGELVKSPDKLRIDRAIEQSSTSIFKILGHEGDPVVLKQGISGAFGDIFGVPVETFPLPEEILARAETESINWVINKC